MTQKDIPEQSATENVTIQACSKCKGAGRFRNRTCSDCGSLGVVGQWRGFVLYWKKGFDTKSLLAWEMEQGIFWLVNILLFWVIIWGFIVLILHILASGFVQVGLLNFWLQPTVRPWWIALLADSYLWYRILQYRRGRVTVSDVRFGQYHQKKIELSKLVTKEVWQMLKVLWKRAYKEKRSVISPLLVFSVLLEFKTTRALFIRLGVSLNRLERATEVLLAREERGQSKQPMLDKRVKQVLFQSFTIAYSHGLDTIEPQTIILALANTDSNVAEVLTELDVDQASLQTVVQWFDIDKQLADRYKKFHRFSLLRPKSDMNRAMTAIATPVLDQFSVDITRLAAAGQLTFCIGRNKEINALFRMIEGGAEAIALVGPDGVGKATLVGAVAERMITEDVPEMLKDKRLVSLSIPKLLAGATTPGVVEERLLMIRDEILRSGNIVLFIQNIHDLVGATAQGEAGLDASELVARIIERGDFPVLATTNQLDWRRFIQGKALGDVLRSQLVEEPEAQEALAIMQSKVGYFEQRYDTFFSLHALQKIVELSERYMHDQVLPEKALDLMEEVAVYVKNKRGEKQLITENDVAQLLSEKIDIPVAQITEVESERLLNLEEIIHRRMVNQDEAVTAVASALRRARTDLRDTGRPIVNLLFLGPTGVGKTELAKTVAAVYFGNEHEIIRLDMSEYQSVTSIARLIGSETDPTGGYLTEQVKRKPFAVVLLDELEKAHPDILNIFLQVMDDGRLTDWAGNTIDFTNVIIIATSNAGTQFIQNQLQAGVSVPVIKDQLLEEQLKQHYRPEFLNRFDNIVVFTPLTQVHIKEIARLMLKKNEKRLADKGIHFEITEAALEEFAQAGYDPLFGARPMRRLIQDRVDDALAKFLLRGKINRRDTVVLDAGGKITVQKATQLTTG